MKMRHTHRRRRAKAHSRPPQKATAQRRLKDGSALLAQAQQHWQEGNWEALSQMEVNTLQLYSTRAMLALLACAGHLQRGNTDHARQCLRQAQQWGAGKRQTIRTLVAGAHGNLSRAFELLGKQDKARQHLQMKFLANL